MSEFHDNYPQYEFMAHHSEEEGKVKRRKLWNVFWIMLIVTIVELIIGSYAKELHLLNDVDRTSTSTLKLIFIGLTLGKAYFIIYSFMHLGDEKKAMKYAVIAPYTIFILYLVYVLVAEANYVKVHKDKMDHLIEVQKNELNAAAAAGGHGHEAGATHEEGATHEAAPAEEHEASEEHHAAEEHH